jgi:hypothetical protein
VNEDNNCKQLNNIKEYVFTFRFVDRALALRFNTALTPRLLHRFLDTEEQVLCRGTVCGVLLQHLAY